MSNQGFTERDWKLFRKKIAGWQESYMDRLCKEYIRILSSGDDASERFWKIEKRIKKDQKRAGVQCEMSRSEMLFIVMELLKDKAITKDELEEFSEEFKETIRMFTERKVGRY